MKYEFDLINAQISSELADIDELLNKLIIANTEDDALVFASQLSDFDDMCKQAEAQLQY